MTTTRSGASTQDPTGLAVSPQTTTGKLRKLLLIIITIWCGGSVQVLCTMIECIELFDFIKYHSSYFKQFATWDTVERVVEKRAPSVRLLIAKIYNSMPFPVRVGALKLRLHDHGCYIKRYRLVQYMAEMGFSSKAPKKITNPCTPEVCERRVGTATAMLTTLTNLWDKSCNEDEHLRWYYYDQSRFNQYDLDDDDVFGPPGVAIYQKDRPKLMLEGVTLHLIVDQYSVPLHWEVSRGGQGEVQLEAFMRRAMDKLPRALFTKGPLVVFCDHLNTHVKWSKMQPFAHFEVHLTPVSCPPADIAENIFSLIKAHIRREVVKEEIMVNPNDWCTWVNKQVGEFVEAHNGNDAWLQHSITFLDDLVEAKGDLQLLEFNKHDIDPLQDLSIQPLECDLE